MRREGRTQEVKNHFTFKMFVLYSRFLNLLAFQMNSPFIILIVAYKRRTQFIQSISHLLFTKSTKLVYLGLRVDENNKLLFFILLADQTLYTTKLDLQFAVEDWSRGFLNKNRN